MSEGLLDLGGYPEFFSHGIGEVHIGSEVSELLFYRWRKIEGVWRRVIVAVTTRPTTQLMQGNRTIAQALCGAGEPPPGELALSLQ